MIYGNVAVFLSDSILRPEELALLYYLLFYWLNRGSGTLETPLNYVNWSNKFLAKVDWVPAVDGLVDSPKLPLEEAELPINLDYPRN